MFHFLSRPDRHLSLCGHLDASVHAHRVEGAPAFLRGLRVLFASDIHVVPRTTPGDIRALGEKIASCGADLVLLGGDYADNAEDAARLFEHLAVPRAPLGCFGVLGNNDREAWGDPEPLRARMAAAGCTLLVNQSGKIPVRGGTLWIAGVDDAKYGEPDARGLYPDHPSGEYWRVLVAHQPRPVDPLPGMMRSGHTHGGQFNLLGFTPYSIGFERLSRRRIALLAVSGWREVDGMRLLVSKGIGASRIPLRVGVRPELDLLRFE